MIPGVVAAAGVALPASGGDIPAGAIYYTSFKDGVYWDGADSTLLDMWFSDPTWGVWVEATVVPGTGLRNTASDDPYDSDPSLVSSLIPALTTSGTTIVMDVTLNSGGNARFDFFKSDYSVEFFVSLPSGGTSFIDGTVHVDSPHSMSIGHHKVAVTITGTKAVISVDGETAVSGAHATTLSAVTSFAVGVTLGVIDTVLFLPPQADADLPALSSLV